MEQTDPTYRASIAERITGVPAHSQRTWRKQGLLPSDKEEGSWTEYAVADLVTMVVMRDLSRRFGIGLKHAARIGQEVALIGLARRRVHGRAYGEEPFLLVTDLDGELEMCSSQRVGWLLQRAGAGPLGIVIDAIGVTFAVLNSLKVEKQEVPAWLTRLQDDYNARALAKLRDGTERVP